MWEAALYLATILIVIMILRKLPLEAPTVLKQSTVEEEVNKSPRELADDYFETGELKKAERMYLKALNENPADAALYNKLGSIYLQEKNFHDAEDAIKQSLELEPDNDIFYNNLGLLYYETEDYDAAIEAYEKSVAINNKMPSRLINLGLAYFMAKKYRRAADMYEQAIILDPRNEQYVELLKQAEEKLK